MRAAALDRRITIETATETPNGIGEPIQTWGVFATVWAQKRQPSQGREYSAADAINAEIDQIFRVRWLSGVTTKMRVNDAGQYYDIQHLAEIGRQEGIDILARVHRG